MTLLPAGLFAIIAAIGDSKSDLGPLQVTQFEADIRIAEQLLDLWLKGRESFGISPNIFAAGETVFPHLSVRYQICGRYKINPISEKCSRMNFEKVLFRRIYAVKGCGTKHNDGSDYTDKTNGLPVEGCH